MRLSVPIVYNFLLLTYMEDSAAFKVLAPVSYVKFLGEDFNKWVFPSLLLIMVLLTLLNLYGKYHKYITLT